MKALGLKEIAQAVKGKCLFLESELADSAVIRVTTDTRTIQKGDLFVPIKGEKFDGHDFLSQAFEKGAICCLSEVEKECLGPIILVENTREALRDLAEYYRSLFKIPVVGVTGSVGKTTTKDLIASVLSQKFCVLKTDGNFNNEIGLPLTVFQLEEKYEVAIFEMGMNHFGEIHNLSKIVKPDFGVISNIGVSHIENLGSREGIFKAKSEIFDYSPLNGTAILNGDDDLLPLLKNKLEQEIIFFGTGEENEIHCTNAVQKGLEGVQADICTPIGRFGVFIPVPGNHMVLNAMAATAVGLKLGLELSAIQKGIEAFVPTKMRMAIIKTAGGLTIIDDAYNANPVSMKASIDVLAGSRGKTTAILGDMFELGEFSDEMHYDVGKYAAQKKIDTIICIGLASQAMCHAALDCGHRNVFYFSTQKQFLETGIQNLEAGSTILVKASRGMHFEKTIEKLNEVNF